MATIRDVAKLAGVSISAVSRALNDYKDINPETKARILRAARELHYYPTASARQLVTNRSHTIGVYFPDLNPGLTQPFIASLLNEIKFTVGAHGYDLLLFANTKAPFDEINFLDRVKHRDVDGVMLFTHPEQALEELANSTVPVVAVDHMIHGKNMGTVTSDNRRAEHELVERLYRNGYRTFGYVHGEMTLHVSVERIQGFYSGMRAVGLTPSPQWIIPGTFHLESGWKAAEKFLELSTLPEVIICAADVIAIGMMQVFLQHGIQIPDEVSIVGFDDIQSASYVFPQLTTIRQDTQAMGKLAAEVLVSLIEDGAIALPQHHVLPTSLVVRQTTRPLPL